MGYGDYIHWTAVIRDLYKYINTGTIEERINKINQFKIGNKKYGVEKFKKDNDTDDFKFFIFVKNANCPFSKQREAKEVFYNNPYVIKSPAKYPNVILFTIVSSDYFIVSEKRFLDHKHAVEQYCEKLGLKEFSNHGDLHFTDKEIEKVKKYLPEKDFIFIEPVNHKPGRSFPFEKYQKLVDTFKDETFVQISPEKFGVNDNKILNNVISYVGKFTYRETILFISYSKLCIVNLGGLSNGSGAVKAKTIAIYPALHNPIMTTYDTEISIYIADENHQSCGTLDGNYKAFKKKFPNGCPKCWELYCQYDENKLIEITKNNIKK